MTKKNKKKAKKLAYKPFEKIEYNLEMITRKSKKVHSFVNVIGKCEARDQLRTQGSDPLTIAKANEVLDNLDVNHKDSFTVELVGQQFGRATIVLTRKTA